MVVGSGNELDGLDGLEPGKKMDFSSLLLGGTGWRFLVEA